MVLVGFGESSRRRSVEVLEEMEEIESSGVGLLTIEWDMMDKSRFFGLRYVLRNFLPLS